jgi:hypothetical protein
MTPRHDDGSISGIEPLYTREPEDDRDWDDMIKWNKEKEDMEKEEKDGNQRAGESPSPRQHRVE